MTTVPDTSWTPRSSAIPIAYVKVSSSPHVKRHWLVNGHSNTEHPACGEYVFVTSEAAFEDTRLCESCRVLMIDYAKRLIEAVAHR